MFVYKISWLPYIFIIGGVGMLFSVSEGNSDPSVYFGSIILIAIGCAWLYFKKQKKEAESSANQNGAY